MSLTRRKKCGKHIIYTSMNVYIICLLKSLKAFKLRGSIKVNNVRGGENEHRKDERSRSRSERNH